MACNTRHNINWHVYNHLRHTTLERENEKMASMRGSTSTPDWECDASPQHNQ